MLNDFHYWNYTIVYNSCLSFYLVDLVLSHLHWYWGVLKGDERSAKISWERLCLHNTLTKLQLSEVIWEDCWHSFIHLFNTLALVVVIRAMSVIPIPISLYPSSILPTPPQVLQFPLWPHTRPSSTSIFQQTLQLIFLVPAGAWATERPFRCW